MAQLLLRGTGLGDVEAVLFDKDGTLSVSEPELITLAQARVFLCLERVEPGLRPELEPLLRRAYGLRHGVAICPAGMIRRASSPPRACSWCRGRASRPTIRQSWPGAFSCFTLKKCPCRPPACARTLLPARRWMATCRCCSWFNGGGGSGYEAGLAQNHHPAAERWRMA